MIPYAICTLTVVPVRIGPSHRSEMGSQILFGEVVEIIDAKGKQWLKVRCVHDDFTGWVPSGQLRALSPVEADAYQGRYAYSLDVFHMLMGAEQAMPITLGSHLPNFDGMSFPLGDSDYTFSGQAVFPEDIKTGPAMVIKMARKLLNAPYLWGGRTAFGIDGAGLVQLAYKIAGISLPRTAESQVKRGTSVDFVEQAMPGDIAFFENNSGRITNAGILLPDNRVIHVAEKVQIDAIDHYGIFSYSEGKYISRLRVVRRMFTPKQMDTLPANKQRPSVVEEAPQQALF